MFEVSERLKNVKVSASAAMTRDAVTTPYSTAIKPQPMTPQRMVDICPNLLFFQRYPRIAA